MQSRWSRTCRAGAVTAAAAVAALVAAILPAQAAVHQPVTAVSAGHAAGAAAPAISSAAGRSSDLLLSGLGNEQGYHLYIARATRGYAWQALATLAPGGVTGERWTGRQCVTGDGTTAVAVVAPWSTVNTTAGSDRGATAIAVDLASGRARVLATGVAAYYFNPGCGTGRDVALTRYLGADQRTTQVLDLDAVTGKLLSAHTVPSEVTAAIPAGGQVDALRGDQLVRLSGARVTTITTVPQTPVTLASGSAGLDVLTTDRQHRSAVWRYSAGHLHASGQGGAGAGLFTGRAGITVSTGMTTEVASDTRALAADGDAMGVSTLGDLALTAPSGRSSTASGLLPRIVTASGTVVRAPAKAPASAHQLPFTGTRPADAAARLTAAAVSSPACAVPRADLGVQVPQPTNDQIDWAADMAVQDALPARPAGFDNLPAGYSPETDFPPPTLDGGAGDHVPAVLVEAIMAQESNMDQASWHVIAGLAGDPLVADYYGNAGDASQPIDYGTADCGYGLGQITDIMVNGAASPALQQRVAVDYAENAAALVQILANKWNQLYAAGITLNNADPWILENWYDAIWAYNSGVEPNAAHGNTTGCTPSPACTDGSGNWGLGWANNPANPVYPADREAFLSGPNGYADAATPADWPYQERVFGWMNVPLLRYDPARKATVQAYAPITGDIVAPAQSTFCNASDHCVPKDPAGQFCQYSSSASPVYLHCWFHEAAQPDLACAVSCTTGTVVAPPGTAEPAAYDPDPPTCSPDLATLQPSSSPSIVTTTIVTDEALPAQNSSGDDVNLAGCSAAPAHDGWSEGGTFGLSNVWDSSGDPLPGQEDLHQLSGGFGGHMWFDHEVGGTDPGDTVTATWTPNLSTASTGAGVYRIYVFVPDIGATATAVYSINENYARPGGAPSTLNSTVNQSKASGWVDIGAYYLRPGATVSLTNDTDAGGEDLGMNAVAFSRLTEDSQGPGWAALGDSYSSGEGAGPWDPATDQPDGNLCHRSFHTYSAQVAYLDRPDSAGLALAACSGAVSADLGLANTSPDQPVTYAPTGQEEGYGTQPPQFAVLSGSTGLVTLTMGGNDINFSGIITDCVTANVDHPNTPAANCVGDSMTSLLDPQLTDPANPHFETTQLEADYVMIHQQAPNAKIVVLTYPNVIPASSTSGCSGLTPDDISWLHGEYLKFTADIKTAVSTEAAAGVPVSVLDESSSFTGHDICASTPWVNTISDADLIASQWDSTVEKDDSLLHTFFHPTATGYSQEADDLTSYLYDHGL